jgi:hypothetical protein
VGGSGNCLTESVGVDVVFFGDGRGGEKAEGWAPGGRLGRLLRGDVERRIRAFSYWNDAQSSMGSEACLRGVERRLGSISTGFDDSDKVEEPSTLLSSFVSGRDPDER